MADEFKIKYDMKYWGTTTPIYATYGNGQPQDVLSMPAPEPPTSIFPADSHRQRSSTAPWPPCPV